MGKYRKNRVNDAVCAELAVIIRDIKDPRVSGSLITITGADVTADFKYAKVFYSVLGADDNPEELKEISKGLKSAAGYARRELAHRLNLRVTPELSFVADNSMKRGVEIASIINNFDFSEDDEEASEEGANEQ